MSSKVKLLNDRGSELQNIDEESELNSLSSLCSDRKEILSDRSIPSIPLKSNHLA